MQVDAVLWRGGSGIGKRCAWRPTLCREAHAAQVGQAPVSRRAGRLGGERLPVAGRRAIEVAVVLEQDAAVEQRRRIVLAQLSARSEASRASCGPLVVAQRQAQVVPGLRRRQEPVARARGSSTARRGRPTCSKASPRRAWPAGFPARARSGAASSRSPPRSPRRSSASASLSQASGHRGLECHDALRAPTRLSPLALRVRGRQMQQCRGIARGDAARPLQQRQRLVGPTAWKPRTPQRCSPPAWLGAARSSCAPSSLAGRIAPRTVRGGLTVEVSMVAAMESRVSDRAAADLTTSPARLP